MAISAKPQTLRRFRSSQHCSWRNSSEVCVHGSVCKTDSEGSAGGRDEGISRVETGPDYNTDVGIDEEFGQKEVAEIPMGTSV